MELNATKSDILLIGDRSANQGSTMSGLIYNIYTLDVPSLFHKVNHNSHEDRLCPETSIKTYVDDIFPIVVAKPLENLNHKIEHTIAMITEYMRAN